MTTAHTPAPARVAPLELATVTADQPEAERDYLFDLLGFRIIDQALTPEQLQAINAWVDRQPQVETGTWLGHVEVHSYQGHDGVNYQNIIEGGEVFEQLIDSPAWIDDVRRYIENDAHRVSLNEAFLNVRRSGGFIGLHSGGHTPYFPLAFRHHTGRWMVGQINILMALTDIGPGDGATSVIPGSHKSHETHPTLRGGGQSVYNDDVVAGEQLAMHEVHLKAGQALMFTDAICHGSIARTNEGERRVMIYRYSPHCLATRYQYVPSDELIQRLTPQRRKIVAPVQLRMRPGRTLRSGLDAPAHDAVG
jgi:hypothetical protein